MSTLNTCSPSGQKTALASQAYPAMLLHCGSLVIPKIFKKRPIPARSFFPDLEPEPGEDPEENLRMLAKRHQELSGSFVNWLATHQHAEQVWQKGLQYQRGKSLNKPEILSILQYMGVRVPPSSQLVLIG